MNKKSAVNVYNFFHNQWFKYKKSSMS
jgi:hypothetical protein